MRIGKINNNINFQRAIRVEVNRMHYGLRLQKKQTPYDDIYKIMREGHCNKCDDEMSSKIRAFLKDNGIEHENGNGGSLSYLANSNFYIFTDEDAKKAREIINQAKKKKEDLDREYLIGPTDDMSPAKKATLQSKELHNIYRQNIYLERDRLLSKLANNRYDYESKNLINVITDDKNRITNVIYYDEKGNKTQCVE